MNPTCDDFDHLANPRAQVGDEKRALWQGHLKLCARCQQQEAADQALRAALTTPPSLRFSEGFDAALQRSLSERRQPRPLSTAARAVLAGYGTIAAGLSVWILSQITWPSGLLSGAAGSLLVLVALATPFMFLPRSSPLSPPGLG